MNTGIKFNYEAANMAVKEIEVLTDELQTTLNKLNNLISENIKNPKIWSGDSAANFDKKWNDFAVEFPSFVSTFRTQRSNVQMALDTRRQTETNNMI